MLFGPDQDPGAVFASEFAADFIDAIMAREPRHEIICMANVKTANRVLQDIHPVIHQNEGLAPAVGFEPTTNRLTADRSTTELRWIIFVPD
jgi:hypothetical protein